MDGYKEYVTQIILKFKKSRQTRFANTNNTTVDNVHVHNQIPVWYLVKLFKTKNNIKSRLFKSLSEEQKASWLAFYDQNKQLALMTVENHKNFHENNTFDVKTATWRKTNQQPIEDKKSNDALTDERIKKRVRVKKNNAAFNEETKHEEPAKKRVRVKKNTEE